MPSAFDLIANPNQIQPAVGFYSIFLCAGLILVAITVIAVRWRWRMRKFLLFFSPLWVGLSLTLLILDARDTLQIWALVRRGDYASVEGCLTRFHPGLPYGSKTAVGDERWTVSGEDFAYGAGEVRPGYHKVEKNGGIVHPNSRVRVSFVRSPYYGRNEIVRLTVLPSPCPFAPDWN